MREELYGPVEILQRTATYVPHTGVPVGAYDDDEVFELNYKKKEWVDRGFRSCVKVEVAILGFPS